MQRNLFLLLSLCGLLLWKTPLLPVQPVFAQELDKQIEKEVKAEKERQKFIEEMQTLQDAAMESGFSEKEIREITVTRNGKVVHIWDFYKGHMLHKEHDLFPHMEFQKFLNLTHDLFQ